MTVTQTDGRRRVVIEGIAPQVDGGRFPAKRTVGDLVRVEADIFTDGHDAIAASLLAHREGSDTWVEIPMRPLVNDRWTGSFRVGELGNTDSRCGAGSIILRPGAPTLLKRIKAGSDARVDYLIGAYLIAEAADRAIGADAHSGCASAAGTLLDRGDDPKELRIHATDPMLNELMLRYPDKRFATESDRELDDCRRPGAGALQLLVRVLPALHGGGAGAARHFCRLREAASLRRRDGLQRLYLPPIHPIGRSFRKGRNNNP